MIEHDGEWIIDSHCHPPVAYKGPRFAPTAIRYLRPDVERIGYLCIQGYPNRICGGCTSACNEPVFASPEQLDVSAASGAGLRGSDDRA